MITNHIALLLLFFIFFNRSTAATVDTVQVYSPSMGKPIPTVVVRPENSKEQTIPTLYLLHGYSGNYANWVNMVPYIKTLVDRYRYQVVCPDGGYGSWYWDSPKDKNYQYETFITKELLPYVESNYRVCTHKTGRGITGLSMGGHGALYLAIRHPELFAAVGSTAGGVDFRPFPNNWEIAERLGASFAENKDLWSQNTVLEMLHLIKPGTLKLYIDCGTEDFFYQVNQALHQKLTYYNIPHTYVSMPGKHDWSYWSQSILLQMAFFDHAFRNN
ncbi:alpha/beta hydrolase [Sphingobacterium sp. Mn56C]|uniref:alpha/beta hydrolase n=1 Tax=Sphingobacterium sp. Mn56C TaxID=3395261 RepID=UPI003BEBAFA3